MTLDEIEKLLNRVKRLNQACSDKSGTGISWQYTFPDDSTTQYSISNIKNPEIVLDLLGSLAVWAWALKDYIKLYQGTEEIEKFVNQNPILCLNADIANLLKHGELDKSRSGFYPQLNQPSYKMPQDSLSGLMFSQNGVHIDVSNPQLTEIEVEVLSQTGAKIGEAFNILRQSMNIWEQKILEIKASN